MNEAVVIETVAEVVEGSAHLAVRWTDVYDISVAQWELAGEGDHVVGGQLDGAAIGEALTLVEATAMAGDDEIPLVVATHVRVIDTLITDVWDQIATWNSDLGPHILARLDECAANASNHADELAEYLSVQTGVTEPGAKRDSGLEGHRYPADALTVATVLYARTFMLAYREWRESLA